MQPSVTPGALIEFHAARAEGGHSPGINSPLTTSWRDTSGNALAGTLTNFTGTPWAGTGTATDPHRLAFDASKSQYLVLPDLSAAEDKAFTYEAVVIPSSVPANMAVMGECEASDTGDLIDLRFTGSGGVGTGIVGRLYDGSAEKTCTKTMTWTTGTRYHVIFACDGSDMRLYLDGALVAGPTSMAGLGTLDLSKTRIGCLERNTWLGFFFAGSIILARIYPFGLSSDQVAANTAAGVTWPASTSSPALLRTLIAGGQNITDLVDWDALDCSSSIHFSASLSIDLPLQSQWEPLPHGVVEGAALAYQVNGVAVWEGTVARLTRSGPADPVVTIEGRGYWAETSDRDDIVKGFVESRYELFEPVPTSQMTTSSTGPSQIPAVTYPSLDTDDQLLISVPIGTTFKTAQRFLAGLITLRGLAGNSIIRRITADYAQSSYSSGAPWTPLLAVCNALNGSAWNVVDWISPSNGKIDQTTGAYSADRLLVDLYSDADGTLTSEAFVQIRNLRLYINRTTLPTIPSAIYEALRERGIAASLESSGTWPELAQLMWDEPGTVEGHISATLGLSNTPILCGIDAGRVLRIKPRPTAPDGTSRHFVVSSALQPGMSCGVEFDAEVAKDYVACTYGLIPINSVNQPTPTSTTWPSEWGRSSTTNCNVYESGSDRWFRILNDATARNCVAEYLPPDGSGHGIPVTAGHCYLARCRARTGGAYTDGVGRIYVRWYTAADVYIATTKIKEFSVLNTTERYYEMPDLAPSMDGGYEADAAYARCYMSWVGNTTGTTSILVRDWEFREITPEGTPQIAYYPSDPGTANAKVGLVEVERARASEALSIAQTAHALWSAPYEGPISGLVGEITTIEGARVPVEEIRPWDWITILDAPARHRGPHFITSVHEAGGEVDINCGGDIAFHYEREITRKRGRYIGARRKWIKPVYRRIKGGARKLIRKGRWVTIPARYS
jgi:hypothetical protein